MKKVMIFILTLLIILYTGVTIFAEDIMKKESSDYIGDDIKNKLNLEGSDNIVRKYLATFCVIFPEYDNIDDMLQYGDILNEHYLVLSDNKVISCQTLRTGSMTKVDNYESSKEFDEFYISIITEGKGKIQKLSSEIEIKNLYYLKDTTLLGSCIYYETNMGDYIYYKSFRVSGEYLFPLDKFTEVIIAIKVERQKYPYNDGGTIDINQVADISAFDMNSSSYNPNANISIINNSSENNIEATNANVSDPSNLNNIIFWGSISLGAVILIFSIVFVAVLIKKKNNTIGKKTQS